MNRGRSRTKHESGEVPPPSADSAGPRASADTDGAAADPLADQVAAQRRVVDIRCGFADLASEEADAAEDRVAQARRQYDEQIAVLARAQAALDKTRTAKEEARRAYRASVAAAGERVQVEAAANAWLGTVNRINGKIRAAQARIERKTEVSEALLAKLDRLSMTAEASRAMADAAIEACKTFRQALQRLEKGMSNSSPAVDAAPAPPAGSKPKPGAAAKPAPAAVKVAATAKPKLAPAAATPKRAAASKPKPAAAVKLAAPILPSPPAPAAASPAAPELASSSAAVASPTPTPSRLSTDWLGIDLRSPYAQPIMRLLRRHRATLSMLVDGLADRDPASRRHWQLLLSSFVDALAAAAIEEAFFEFPPGDPFWGLFTPDQAREVARGLAALGFRYDGMGEFADGHVPGQRDLALAVGAAGMLPVRIRFWPSAAETAALFRGVRVATDLFVAQRAPALTLGEMVRILGRRAEQLTELWNDWPRVRPVLLTAIIE